MDVRICQQCGDVASLEDYVVDEYEDGDDDDDDEEEFEG
jgi:hypothetical protein